jgi:hypothetical protein
LPRPLCRREAGGAFRRAQRPFHRGHTDNRRDEEEDGWQIPDLGRLGERARGPQQRPAQRV